jgi:ketosteroid isomerase-like protein
MRVYGLGMMGVLFLGMALTGCASESPGRMISEARKLDQRFVQVFNNQDLNNVMACYWSSPELVVFTPEGELCRGWNAAKDMYDESLPKMKGAKLELTETHYDVAGDKVIAWGLWRMTMAPMAGEPGEIRGSYTEVSARRHGSWVYLIDHPSLTLPPGPTTKPGH